MVKNESLKKNPKLKEISDEIVCREGLVPNFVLACSRWPDFLIHKLKLNNTVFATEGAHLPRGIKEIVAHVISKEYHCNYCEEHHLKYMKDYGISHDLASQIDNDYKSSNLEDRIKALIDFAKKVASDNLSKSDFQSIKNFSWSEDEIFELIVLVATVRSDNIIADSLNLSFEKELIAESDPRTPIQR